MILGPSFGAFLGTAFFAFLCAYILFNLVRDQKVKRRGDGTEEVVEHNIKHKFLQLILWGLILLSLIINGAAVTDMSSQTCDWLLENETTIYRYDAAATGQNDNIQNTTTTRQYAYTCNVEENTQAITYQMLLYRLGIPLIGFYIIMYFIVMGFRKVAEIRREERRRQGR